VCLVWLIPLEDELHFDGWLRATVQGIINEYKFLGVPTTTAIGDIFHFFLLVKLCRFDGFVVTNFAVFFIVASSNIRIHDTGVKLKCPYSYS